MNFGVLSSSIPFIIIYESFYVLRAFYFGWHEIKTRIETNSWLRSFNFHTKNWILSFSVSTFLANFVHCVSVSAMWWYSFHCLLLCRVSCLSDVLVCVFSCICTSYDFIHRICAHHVFCFLLLLAERNLLFRIFQHLRLIQNKISCILVPHNSHFLAKYLLFHLYPLNLLGYSSVLLEIIRKEWAYEQKTPFGSIAFLKFKQKFTRKFGIISQNQSEYNSCPKTCKYKCHELINAA